jgi:predicted phage tail protein
MLTEVRLYGHLGERFGKVHHFAIQNAAQAISALKANFPDFAAYLYANSEPGYYIIKGKNQGLVEEELGLGMEIDVLKIVPAVQGRKGAGGFQMIAGAALIVIAAALYAYGFAYGQPWAVALGDKAYALGQTFILMGVATYLSQPKEKTKETSADKPVSYAFDGPENTVAQGGPVPVVYGMLAVGSTVGAMAIYAEDASVTTGGTNEDDNSTAAGFHIWSPRTDCSNILTVGDTGGWSVSDQILSVNGTGGVTYTVEESTGTFKLGPDGHSLATVSGLPLFPSDGPSSWEIKITATDSAAHVVTKKIVYSIVIDSNWRPDGSASSLNTRP